MQLSRLIALCACLLSLWSCAKLDLKEKLRPTGDVRAEDPFFGLWARNLDPEYSSGNLPIALQAPYFYEGLLFIGSNNGRMNAYDASNGRPVWQSSDGGEFHASPIAFKDQLIYGNSAGRIFSRNLYTGELKYSVDLDSSIESQALVSDGRLIFHTRGHKIFTLDVETGKILWAYRRSVPYLTTVQRVSRPLIHKGKIIVGFADGAAAAFSLEEGVLLWEQKLSIGTKFVDVDADPILYSGKLIMGSREGNLSVLNPDTGAVLREFEEAIGRTPVIANGKLHVLTTDGRVIVFDESFRELSNTLVDPKGLTNLVSWREGWLATTLGREIYYLDQKFARKSSLDLGHTSSAVFSEAATWADKVAFITSRNRLYVFGNPYQN